MLDLTGCELDDDLKSFYDFPIHSLGLDDTSVTDEGWDRLIAAWAERFPGDEYQDCGENPGPFE